VKKPLIVIAVILLALAISLPIVLVDKPSRPIHTENPTETSKPTPVPWPGYAISVSWSDDVTSNTKHDEIPLADIITSLSSTSDVIIPPELLGNMTYRFTQASSSGTGDMDTLRIVGRVQVVAFNDSLNAWEIDWDTDDGEPFRTFTLTNLSSSIKVGQVYDALAQMRSNRNLIYNRPNGYVFTNEEPSLLVWNLISIQPTIEALPMAPSTPWEM